MKIFSDISEYAIIPDNLITCMKDHSQKGQAVIVRNGIIEDLVLAGEIPSNLQMMFFPGCTLMPGLIDAHIHLDKWELPLCLANGITTVRDTGNDLDFISKLKAKMESPRAQGPRIMYCGPLLDCGEYWHPIISWGMEGTDDIKYAIQCLRQRKVDAVKLYAGLTPEQIKTAVDEAKRSGLPILGHFDKYRLLDALRAGIGEIEHLLGFNEENFEEIIEEIRRNNVWTVPTQIVLEQLMNIEKHDSGVCKRLKYVPENVKGFWSKYRDFMISKDPGLVKLSSRCENLRKYLKLLIGNNCRIVAGSDAPCLFSMPGFDLISELLILSECGMSNCDVLRSCTVKAAELLGVSSSTGTLEAGKVADMILIEGDPSEDLKCLRKLRLVFKQGYIHRPEDMLDECSIVNMGSDVLPDFSEKAVIFHDWKKRYKELLINHTLHKK